MTNPIDYEDLGRAALVSIEKRLGLTHVAYAKALQEKLGGDSPHPVTVAQWRSGAVKNPGASFLIAAGELLRERENIGLEQVLAEEARKLEARNIPDDQEEERWEDFMRRTLDEWAAQGFNPSTRYTPK
jgi:hypothetical protein